MEEKEWEKKRSIFGALLFSLDSFFFLRFCCYCCCWWCVYQIFLFHHPVDRSIQNNNHNNKKPTKTERVLSFSHLNYSVNLNDCAMKACSNQSQASMFWMCIAFDFNISQANDPYIPFFLKLIRLIIERLFFNWKIHTVQPKYPRLFAMFIFPLRCKAI